MPPTTPLDVGDCTRAGRKVPIPGSPAVRCGNAAPAVSSRLFSFSPPRRKQQSGETAFRPPPQVCDAQEEAGGSREWAGRGSESSLVARPRQLIRGDLDAIRVEAGDGLELWIRRARAALRPCPGADRAPRDRPMAASERRRRRRRRVARLLCRMPHTIGMGASIKQSGMTGSLRRPGAAVDRRSPRAPRDRRGGRAASILTLGTLGPPSPEDKRRPTRVL
jgi:hypothetical protein